jgi:hypothetical protein
MNFLKKQGTKVNDKKNMISNSSGAFKDSLELFFDNEKTNSQIPLLLTRYIKMADKESEQEDTEAWKTSLQEDIIYFLEKNKYKKLDKNSIDFMRKFAFFRLANASKKYHIEKVYGKNLTGLQKTKKFIAKLYSNYINIKKLSNG